MDLFEEKENRPVTAREPLSYRMSPETLDEFVGQEHLTGEGRFLRRLIESGSITSLVFYGQPGCGKSALAKIIARVWKAHFSRLNAVGSGVADLQKEVGTASKRWEVSNKHTVLLVDEFHHFNRSQQDVLLPWVENGTVRFIGITTENPFYYVNRALISRSQVFEFKPLNDGELKLIVERALKDKNRGLGGYRVKIDEAAVEHLIKNSDGDARRVLNALELGVITTKPVNGAVKFDIRVAEESIQKRALSYDKKGDGHYDTISAFIKSMRGSDPDAALYWLAKMLYAGEDPRFIARRIVICASEDVGNADPQALPLANSAFQAVEAIGMPEARIVLAQAAVYVAAAQKSNAAYRGIESALKDVEKEKTMRVPKHLTKAGQKDYKYPHDYPDNFVDQDYIPEKREYYFPKDTGYERKIKELLENIKGKKSGKEKIPEEEK